MKVGCVIPARNEEKFVGKTIEAVKRQTIDIQPIILVDDNSTDNTGKTARKAGAEVIQGPDHKYEARTLRICETVNHGLMELPKGIQYVMIVGADDIIPSKWSASLIESMEKNENIVIASGVVAGSGPTRTPRGIRMVDYIWWKREHEPPGLYRELYCWESFLVFFAWWKGYSTYIDKDLVTVPQRATGSEISWQERGKGMRQCGADILQVFWRTLRLSYSSGLDSSINLMSSYLESEFEPDPWLVEFRKNLVKRRIEKRLKKFAGRLFPSIKG